MKKKHTQRIENTNAESQAEGTYFSYTLGFALSIVATLIPYALLQYHVLAGSHLVIAVVAFALIQLLVQLVLFLHLSFRRRGVLNLVIFVYTIIIVGIIVIGTLWIMKNLSNNMTDTMFPNGSFTPQSAAF